MISIFEIMEKSKPHRSGMGGRQTVISNNEVEVSIVGGSRGLYGDFVEDFELAIMDSKTKDFVTKFYFPDSNDDVLSYIQGDEVENLVNNIFRNGNFRFL